MEHYSAIKKEIMPFTTTWMDLKIIKPSKVSQKEKDKYYVHIHLQVDLKYDTNEHI